MSVAGVPIISRALANESQGGNVATPCSVETTIGIGLDDESWKALSSTDANSLLRILLLSSSEENRTYSSVTILPPVDGRSLYVKPH